MTPLSPEAVAQMVQRMRMYAVAWGERPSVSPYADTAPGLTTGRVIIDTGSAADMLTTLAAENATLRADAGKALQWAKEQHACADEYAAELVALRASEAAALESLAEIGVVVAALEGKDSLDRELIRNIGTRIAALTPTADKEPKT